MLIIQLIYYHVLVVLSPDQAQAWEVEEEGADDELCKRLLIRVVFEGGVAKLDTQAGYSGKDMFVIVFTKGIHGIYLMSYTTISFLYVPTFFL